MRTPPVDCLEPRRLLSAQLAPPPSTLAVPANPDPVRLVVSLSTGEVRIVSDNPADPGEIGIYEITSASSSMDASKWNSLADQGVVPGWGELIANDGYVAENTNSPSAASVVPATGFNLGQLFRPGRSQDLAFSYGDENNSYFEGTVAYVTQPPAQIVDRRTFYNNSAFDGGDPAVTADDDLASDSRKQALLPGGTATFANITSYARGINGIMVDIKGLPPDIQLAPSDFAFRTGTGPNPAAWAQGPAPREIRRQRP
jgi:hypothetical protein